MKNKAVIDELIVQISEASRAYEIAQSQEREISESLTVARARTDQIFSNLNNLESKLLRALKQNDDTG